MPEETHELVTVWQRPRRATSKRTLWGMPLYDIVIHPEPPPATNSARGIVAVGRHATGVFASGGVTARGVVAFAGGAAFGVFAYAGGLGVGLVAFSGGASLAGLALAGGVALGGYVGAGGFASGAKVITNSRTSPDLTVPGALGEWWAVEGAAQWWIALAVLLPVAVALVVFLRTKSAALRENA